MILIAVLFLVACAGSIYAAWLIRHEKERRVIDVIERIELGVDLDETARRPESGLAAQFRRLMPDAMMQSYRERLLWAGRPAGLDAGQFVSLKLVAAALVAALVPVLGLFPFGSMLLVTMGIGALTGFTLPDAWLGAKVADRRRQVAEELPLFADLVATAISAGLPLTEAVRRVAADAPGLVAREFLRAVQEMAAGKQRSQSWRDLMQRVPGDDLRAIVNAIMQAEQYGTSVAEILRYQVQQIRLFKQQEAQRIAQSVTVKMRIPMLLLILLPFMILLLGPALMQIVDLL